MVQAQNDFITASTALNKARSTLNLAQINDKRQRLLYEGKAVPLKEVQQAQGTLDAAENDVRSAEVALEAARNRLRILGKTDQEITEFQDQGHDQSGHADLCADRRDDRAAQGRTGAICRQRRERSGLRHRRPVDCLGGGLYPRDRGADGACRSADLFHRPGLSGSRLSRPRSPMSRPRSIPTTRRLLVRASVDNAAGLLKPEMFASVKILTGEGDTAVAVPRDAIIHEGERARVWVARDDDTAIELRQIKLGLTNGTMVEVLDGLAPSDRVITKGSLFIDRVAAAATGS